MGRDEAMGTISSGGIVIILVALIAIRYLFGWFVWAPSTKPDRKQDECEPLPDDTMQAADGHSGTGIVKTIRLTDDGEFAKRCELTNVLYETRNPGKPTLVVWYVHGWKHNAKKNDSDYLNFRRLIADLVTLQKPLGDAGRHVVGVYVGWDGAVGPAWLRNLTFWNRKRAADRISQSAILTRIFSSVKNSRKQRRKDAAMQDLSIMIGHSFGARILFTATSHGLIDDVQRRHPGFVASAYGLVEGPSDLILLLNPAFEASIFTTMHNIRRRDAKWWEAIGPGQLPRLLSIATTNDRATGWLFPPGRFLEFATRWRQAATLGNYQPYTTHTLTAASTSERQPAADGFWFDHFAAAGLRLDRKAESRQPGNPFLVASTTRDIVNGHNGIWGPALRAWVVAFLKELSERSPR